MDKPKTIKRNFPVLEMSSPCRQDIKPSAGRTDCKRKLRFGYGNRRV